MVRLLGMCVAMLGIASLVFGIIFVVMAGSARAEVFDSLKDEGFPVFGPSEDYPYLGLTTAAVAEGDIIDTAEDLDASADALDAARWEMVEPPAGVAGFTILFGESTFPAEMAPEPYTQNVNTLQLHEYSALLGFSGVLGMSQAGLGIASMMQTIGIVTIIVGVALILTGLLVFKLASSRV